MSESTSSETAVSVAGPGNVPHAGDAVCWAALSNDAACGVAVIDGAGRFEFANGIAAAQMGCENGSVEGQHMEELFDQPAAEERLSHIRRVLDSWRPLVVDGMIQGRRHRTVLRPIPPDGGRQARVLMVSRPACAWDRERPGEDVVQARHQDSGAIGLLTPRELEVLSMIGKGLSTADIADTLHRSVKTVEWHRVSLGNKLGASNRVELARIAIRAGLCTLDD